MRPSSIVASVIAESIRTGLGAATLPDLRVVALGGGTGLATVLRGLHEAVCGARPWDPAIRILPSTAQKVTLQAELSDGTVIDGESRIPGARSPIRRVRLQPGEAQALPEAVDALERADLIVIGPGSLYSRLVAVLLVRGLPDAIARSRARVALVVNLMTEPGETDRHTAVDHLIAIRRHAPTIPIHDVVLNVAPISPTQLIPYAARGAAPIVPDQSLLKALGHRVVECDLLAAGDSIKHDPGKLARALLGRAR
jgi:uncharacterized cofD-like protein